MRRPHLSASRVAGILLATMTMAEMPDAWILVEMVSILSLRRKFASQGRSLLTRKEAS